MSCFGYTQDVTGEWICAPLQDVCCDGENTSCKFYKTRELLKKQRQNRPQNKYRFSLLIDGVKYGEYSSIAEMDLYLTKYYLEHQKAEDSRAVNFKGEYLAIFENHSVRFLEGDEWEEKMIFHTT